MRKGIGKAGVVRVMASAFACIVAFVAMAAWCALPAYASECPAGGDHDYAVQILQPATETQDGLREFTCTKCADTFTQAIPMTGHHWGEWVVQIEPTCTTEGYRYRECTHYEGDTHRQEEILLTLSPTGEHMWVETSRIDPTCEDPGSITYVCSICGQANVVDLDAKGHDWGEWNLTREPTPDADGEEESVCANNPTHVRTRVVEYAGEEGEPASEEDIDIADVQALAGEEIPLAKVGDTALAADDSAQVAMSPQSLRCGDGGDGRAGGCRVRGAFDSARESMPVDIASAQGGAQRVSGLSFPW